MKLSRKFLNDYVNVEEVDYQKLADKMTSVGNEYCESGKLVKATGLIVGEVIECENHPDSDHLHVCKVNIGKEVLDIVCGAPNVRKGLKVIVAQVGAILPEVTIKKGTIRGVESNGMLCSLAELGIDKKYLTEKDVNGICELPVEFEVGGDPIKLLNLDDEVIDFELTSNRGDLLSVLGMAYEVGAIYNKEVKDVDLIYKTVPGKMNFNLDVKTKKCPLFLARKAINVKIKESPDFIKKRLMASGIRPINNIVDISNYVMLELGQPLHYYDADNLGDSLIVRDADDKEELTTLDNQKRILSKDDIVIANKNEAVGLAGVMGGLSTEVTDNTKNVLIESAIFDNISIRLTSKKILRSEASNRFEKGLDPKRTYMAMERSCVLLQKYADAEIIDDIVVYDNINKEDKLVEITRDDIVGLLGMELTTEDIADVFNRLKFNVENDGDLFRVNVPSRRQDISIKADLVEEVARIYGIDNIQGKSPVLSTKSGSFNKFIRIIREKMISLGLNETLSYTLIPNSEAHKFTLDSFEEINLLDPMSDDRKTLRYSLLPSLEMIYEYNAKRNNKDVFIFEIAKAFGKKETGYYEGRRLACLMSGNFVNGLYKEKVTFYHIKGVMEELLNSLGFDGRYKLVVKELPKELHPGQSAVINLNGQDIGFIGKVHPNENKNDIYVMEIDLDVVENFHAKKLEYKEISKFPNIVKDVAFVLPKNINNEDVIAEIKKNGGKYLTKIELFDLYVGENIDSNMKSLAYNLTFNDKDSTLTDEIIMPIFNKIMENVCNKFKASVRDK